MWIGYRDVEGGERDWRWKDGSNTTYTDWQSGQPDSSGGDEQDCAAYHLNKWYDLGCLSIRVNAFLCKGEFILTYILNMTLLNAPARVQYSTWVCPSVPCQRHGKSWLTVFVRVIVIEISVFFPSVIIFVS